MNGGVISPGRIQPNIRQPRFGSAAEVKALKEAVKIGQEGVAKIANEGIADGLLKFFSKGLFQRDVRVGGMSLEDMAARLQTLIGVYILQGYLSIKEKKHPWETNGRNVVVWLLTTYVVQFLKNDSFGINTLLLNPFMKPKVDYSKPVEKVAEPVKQAVERKGFGKLVHAVLEPLGKLLAPLKPVVEQIGRMLDRLINPLRMDINYVDILERAGVKVSESEKKAVAAGKKSLWASQDVNLLSRVNNLYDSLQAKVKAEGLESLSAQDQKIFKELPSFLKRVNFFPIISTALITAATVYIIGSLAMKIVYKFIAPLDKDFIPKDGKDKGQNKSPAATSAEAQPHISQLSIHRPRAFEAFGRPGGGHVS